MRNFFIIIFCLFLPIASLQAGETRYVNDYLVITLRTGMGPEYRIIKTLPSGTALAVLEEVDQYVRVKTPSGVEGWVGKQYLRDTPVARDQLVQLNSRVEKLGSDNRELLSERSVLQKRIADLQSDQARLTQENDHVTKENRHLTKVSARPLELQKENERLKSEAAQSRAEASQLGEKNRKLETSSVQKWFMAGSAVLLLGIITGLILPKLKRRKPSGWS